MTKSKIKYIPFATICCLILIAASGCFLHSCKPKTEINFNAKEAAWLKEHPTILLSVDTTYPPLNYVDASGQITGLNIDLMRLIEQRLGVKFQYVGSNWDQALSLALEHKVDGVLNATPKKERENKLSFTIPVTQDPQALVKRKNPANDPLFEDDMKVAAKKNSIQLDLFRKQYPNTQVVEVNDLYEGVKLLSINEVDAVYDDLAPLYHMINSNNLINLKIDKIEYNNQPSSVGLRNNAPELLSAFNKVIRNISEEEKNAIKQKWLKTSPEQDYTVVYFIVGLLLAITLVAIIGNWSLRTLVKNKTKALNQELEERKRMTDKLDLERKYNNKILDAIPGIFFMYETEPQPRLIRWNKNLEITLGYQNEELMHSSPYKFIVDRETKNIETAIHTVIDQGNVELEGTLITSNGEELPHLLVSKTLTQGDKLYFLGFGLDISKQVEMLKELEMHRTHLESMVKQRTLELEKSNNKLSTKNKQISIQADELTLLNKKLNDINENLEKLVYQRTREISEKNEQLIKYSFDNAHKVRAPLARIMGILNLIDMEYNQELHEYYSLILKESKDMDEIVRQIGQELYDSAN